MAEFILNNALVLFSYHI